MTGEQIVILLRDKVFNDYGSSALLNGDHVTVSLNQLVEIVNLAIAAAPAQAEPVGVIVANDPVHGWHMRALVDWEAIGEGTKLYAVPKR